MTQTSLATVAGCTEEVKQEVAVSLANAKEASGIFTLKEEQRTPLKASFRFFRFFFFGKSLVKGRGGYVWLTSVLKPIRKPQAVSWFVLSLSKFFLPLLQTF